MALRVSRVSSSLRNQSCCAVQACIAIGAVRVIPEIPDEADTITGQQHTLWASHCSHEGLQVMLRKVAGFSPARCLAGTGCTWTGERPSPVRKSRNYRPWARVEMEVSVKYAAARHPEQSSDGSRDWRGDAH